MNRVMGNGKKAGVKPATKKKAVVGKVGGKPTVFVAPASLENLENGGRPPLTEDNLSDKHIHFCRRYAIHGNGCKASREAGFNEAYYKWALNQEVLMSKVFQFRAERSKKFELSADRVIGELVKVAFGSLNDFIDIQRDGTPIIDCSNVGPEEMAALSGIEQDTYFERGGRGEEDEPISVKKTKLKMHDKLKALEMLSRHLKLFKDEEIDNLTPTEKAAKIRNALAAMMCVDGEAPIA